MATNEKKAAVHKDFHGALSYGMQYVYENYGNEALEKYLRQIGKNVFGGLSEGLKKDGLPVLESHWKKIFTVEDAKFKLQNVGEELVLEVIECPAIKHMQKMGYPIFSKFCEHTRIINEEICGKAGYGTSLEYDQEKGSCTQRFWKVKKS